MRTVYELGPFRLDTEARVLTQDGIATELGARGVAVLAALVSRAGEYVEKSVIVDAAWPGLVVEEANLAVQISATRRVLARVPDGTRWVETLTRRGYRFVGPVARRPEPSHAVTAPANDEPPSIGVLPFVNRSHDPEDEYFSDGLADELVNVLAKIRGLRVAARTSSFRFKGKDADIAVIGRSLNVATLLEGSVRKAGNRMRISVELVKVTDGYELWSETYDRTLEDIVAVQDDIAQSVVKELRGTLLGKAVDANAATRATAQVAVAVKGRTSDAEAHRLYLQARHLIARATREDVAKGIGYLKQALDRDPRFARAWSQLGGAYATQASQVWDPIHAGWAMSRHAVARALDLEPELDEAHALMGIIHMLYDWDWRGAEASFARALESAPGNTYVTRAAYLAACLGRLDDAIGLFRRALEHDLLSPRAHFYLGIALEAAGRLAEAEQAYRTSIEQTPQTTLVHAWLAVNLLAQGRSDEALEEALREPEQWARLRALAIVHRSAGRAAEADSAVHELAATDAPSTVAQVFAAWDETDLAFEWLERAYQDREPGTAEVKFQPVFQRLHADPRWNVFLHKMGLDD
jgi:TolB-like protein/Tfp pilus assembly protein PilF